MARLDEIAEIALGATPTRGHGTMYLRLSNVISGRIVGPPLDSGPALKGGQSRTRLGDLLVRGRGPDLSAALVGPSHMGLYPTTELFLIRSNQELADPAYLAAFINQAHVQGALVQAAQGSGFVRLNRPA